MKARAFEPQDSVTVSEFLAKFLTICEKKKQLARNTLDGYRVNINHINAHIGNVYLNKITADILDDMFYALSDEGLSGTSCLYIYRTLHSAFETAVKRRELQYNFCDMIEPPKKNKFKAKFINENKAEALFKQLLNSDVKYSLPILLSLFLGIREPNRHALKALFSLSSGVFLLTIRKYCRVEETPDYRKTKAFLGASQF